MFEATLKIPEHWQPMVGQSFMFDDGVIQTEALIIHVEPGLIRLLVEGDGPDRYGVAGYRHEPGCSEEGQ